MDNSNWRILKNIRPLLKAEIARRNEYVQDAVRPDPAWECQINEEWREIFERYGYNRSGTSS